MLNQNMAQMNEQIRQAIQHPVAYIHQAVSYLFDSPGKQLRPLLCLASAHLCGACHATHFQLAAAVELIHTGTLLHDDVVDHATMRRHKKTAHYIWGNKTAILAGDFLLGNSFRLITQIGHHAITEMFAQTAHDLAEGQLLEEHVHHTFDMDQESYITMIKGKTGSLFQTACSASAVLSYANHAPRKKMEAQQALGHYGMNLGVAFQLIDDVLDFTALNYDFGKDTGHDLHQQKMTFPILVTYLHANDQDKQRLQRFFNRSTTPSEAQKTEIIQMLEKHHAFARTMETAYRFGQAALNALEYFKESAYYDALYLFSKSLLSRKK